jgi:hypothetical protein
VTTQTPLIDEVFARVLPCVTDGASASSASIDSQSPRLDSDNAIHNARKGLIASTPSPERARMPPERARVSPERARLTRRLCGASSGLAVRGSGRKFTALGYR